MRRNTDFVKPTIYYKPLDLFGKNLITVEGEAWKHMHQLLAPTFGDRQMHQVVEKTHLAVDCLSIQSDVAQMTMQITFNVIGTIVYGQDMLKDHKLKPLLLSVLHNAFWYFLIPDFCLRYLPFQRTRELHQDWQDLNQELERILEKRDFLDDSTASLLSHLWLNQKMTKDDMLANFFVLMTAGFETTGRTLVLLLTLLAFHPQAMRRLQEEVDQVLGNKRFETSDLKNLPYLQGVMYETLRLYPQVPIIPKITEDDQMVGDVFVPKRTNVAIHAAALHMDPSVYPNPEAFKPERWLQKDAQSVDGSFIPFSFGPRQCIGRRFATMEIFTVVSRLIQKYEWTCTDGP
ncbi:cytochrome P450, partial [Gorgonomyces haynaldii]